MSAIDSDIAALTGRTPLVRRDLIDEIVTVAEADAYEVGRQLARQEGIASRISTGAVVYAALQVGQRGVARSPDCRDPSQRRRALPEHATIRQCRLGGTTFLTMYPAL